MKFTIVNVDGFSSPDLKFNVPVELKVGYVGPLKFFYQTGNCNAANIIDVYLSKTIYLSGASDGFSQTSSTLYCSFKYGDVEEDCNLTVDNSDADWLIYRLGVNVCTDATLYEVTISSLFSNGAIETIGW